MERLTSKRVNGIKSGYWSAAKKDELITRLAEYEDTGKTPEEIRGFEETARKMVERTISLHRELKAEQSKDEWIPVCEKLPELEMWVLATVKRHRWISDYKEDVPDDWKVDHPEVSYVTLAKRNAEGWWYIDMECDSLNYDLNPEDYEGKEDLGCPWVEVLAWKMIPRGCGNERN